MISNWKSWRRMGTFLAPARIAGTCPHGEGRGGRCRDPKLPLHQHHLLHHPDHLHLMILLLPLPSPKKGVVSLAAYCGSRRACAQLASARTWSKLEMCRAGGFASSVPACMYWARKWKLLSLIRRKEATSSCPRKSPAFNTWLLRGHGFTASSIGIGMASVTLGE